MDDVDKIFKARAAIINIIDSSDLDDSMIITLFVLLLSEGIASLDKPAFLETVTEQIKESTMNIIEMRKRKVAA